MGVWGLAPRTIFEAAPSRISENALVAKLNVVLFIITPHAKEEKLIVHKSDPLYATSVNYWGEMPPVPSVYGPAIQQDIVL